MCASVALMAQTPAIGDQFAIDESGTGGHIINYEVTSVGPNEVKVAASGHTIATGVKLEIPAEVTYAEQTWAVTALEDEVFYENNALSEVVLPSSITEIPLRAFSGSSITKITIPSSVTDISDNALSNCLNLTEIDFEDVSTLKSTSWNSFSNSKIITDQTADGWVTIGQLAVNYRGAFSETLVVPEGIVNMTTSVYYPNASGFDNVKKIVLPFTLKQIDPYAFAQDTEQKMANLETVEVKATTVPQIGGGSAQGYDLRLFSDHQLKLVVPCGCKAAYQAESMWQTYQEKNQTYASIEENCTTALDETATDASAVKRLVNGQLFIERDGKTFNAQGIEVK
ncbi:MAG: leucine-rich repeat domain-containing protein [Paludibacteraceae bacterium]|nr:leucine-rich repeat domain-containing protein [Paludibacteraceae bacterium]